LAADFWIYRLSGGFFKMNACVSKILAALGFLVVVLGMNSPAMAGPTCTTKPQGEWLSPEQMKERIVQMGYRDIRTFKITDRNCYEIYGVDPLRKFRNNFCRLS
jgi:hypothetical protein